MLLSPCYSEHNEHGPTSYKQVSLKQTKQLEVSGQVSSSVMLTVKVVFDPKHSW